MKLWSYGVVELWSCGVVARKFDNAADWESADKKTPRLQNSRLHNFFIYGNNF
jgi:hypothetical protein